MTHRQTFTAYELARKNVSTIYRSAVSLDDNRRSHESFLKVTQNGVTGYFDSRPLVTNVNQKNVTSVNVYKLRLMHSFSFIFLSPKRKRTLNWRKNNQSSKG